VPTEPVHVLLLSGPGEAGKSTPAATETS